MPLDIFPCSLHRKPKISTGRKTEQAALIIFCCWSIPLFINNQQRNSHMANSLLTINMITREAVRLWKNTNAFIQNIEQQYDDSFAKVGAKIGTQLRVRLPNDYTVRTGAAAQIQDTTEQSTTLVVATQQGVDVSFSSVDRTMSLDDYSERVLAPCINNLAGAIAANIMSGVEGGICNLVSNTDSNGNIISPILSTFLNAGATLDTNSAPTGRRKIVNDPFTQARTVGTLTGLLNPITDISRQYTTGTMAQAIGFEWMMDQTVLKHTTGTLSAGTVSGGGQTGLTVTVTGTTGTLVIGDIITFANVNAVNRITKTTTGQLRQFVVTAAATSGFTSISIYPAIVPPVGGNQVQYQTTDSSPANGAAITLATPASSIFRKNIAYTPEAITMATADLVLPQQGIVEGARESFDNISMRMITDYTVGTDQLITRLDVLYGYLYVRPEWACVICDAI
jgi:hypothetical protein